MGYSSKGRKPIERASKIAHIEIIKNPEVQAYIGKCILPSAPDSDSIESMLTDLKDVDLTEVSVVIAIDGGYTETFVREQFPSASIAFFTFGPLLFSLADLRALDCKRFIAPEDLHKLKQIERYTLVLPTKGIRHSGEPSLSATIRRAVYDFFEKKRGPERDQLLTSLKWFLFRQWKQPPDENLQVDLERCPYGCGHGSITFSHAQATMKNCPSCGQPVYLTDCFRLHERVDEEMGGSGINAYVMNVLEQLVLVHLIHNILLMKPSLLRNVLFIKDGPLAFFGLVAPLYRPMRELVEHLLNEPSGPTGPILRVVGLEKSGAFVEHATTIQDRMRPGSFFIAGDSYIRRHVIPGGGADAIYGQNTYYGQKVIFRALGRDMYVATVPARTYKAEPEPSDIPYLQEILALLTELRCSMYDNALIPVALANKLVSLSEFPSQRILTTFVRQIGKT